MCNVTERIIAIRDYPRSLILVPIESAILLVINSNLDSVGDTVVYWWKNRQNCQFVPTPVSEIALGRADLFQIL